MPDEIKIASETQSQEISAVMTEAELAEAKRYGRMELICTLVDKTVDLAYLALAAFLLAKPLDEWLKDYTWLEKYASLRLLALFAAVTLLHIAVSFPFSFYSGYRLEHKFKLSTLTFGGWLWRYLKRNLLGLALGLAMMLGLYWLIWTAGPWWWLAAAGAFFLVSVILGQLAPVLILPLFYKIEKLDAPELTHRIAKLAAGTGLSIEGVYRMDLSAETVKANAMLAGLGRTRRVLMGDTLLNGFTPDEIEVIFAHEIGHHVFRHIRKMILAGILYSAAGFCICDAILRLAVVDRTGSADIYANLPVWTLPLLMFVFSVFAQLLEPLQNAVSRHYERQSDRYALERTGRREAYLSAFRKLAKLNKDDPHPHRLEVFLFHSHPPIGERLAQAEG
ncbi:MAG: M48 family metallopeptidase [Pirellulales bacterium]|nr:M48 family metallopeptidase [Pirellulales bacterium]